jgi:hypothetical protein
MELYADVGILSVLQQLSRAMCRAAKAPDAEEQQQQEQPQPEAMEGEPVQEQEPAVRLLAEEDSAPKEAAPTTGKGPQEAPRLQRRARMRNAAVAAAIEAEEWRSDADEENSEEDAGDCPPML